MRTAFIFMLAFLVLAGAVLSESADLKMRIFKPENRRAASLYPVIEHLKSDDGKVTIDERTDSLIVVDHPSNLDRMASVLEQLDVPLEQVEINVLVAEATDSLLGKIGLDLARPVIKPEKFNEMRYLLQESDKAAVRSQMSVKTLSGQPAVMRVAQEEILWGKVVSPPESKVITVAPVGTRSAGRFLEVLPKVNNDGSITVTVRPTVSEFQEDRSVFERSVVTQVIIDSGDTIVIGGVETGESRTRKDGIPYAGISLSSGKEESGRVVMFLTATVSGRD
jgi:type II secretory pathway component GspD/PulD (secretin)